MGTKKIRLICFSAASGWSGDLSNFLGYAHMAWFCKYFYAIKRPEHITYYLSWTGAEQRVMNCVHAANYEVNLQQHSLDLFSSCILLPLRLHLLRGKGRRWRRSSKKLLSCSNGSSGPWMLAAIYQTALTRSYVFYLSAILSTHSSSTWIDWLELTEENPNDHVNYMKRL